MSLGCDSDPACSTAKPDEHSALDGLAPGSAATGHSHSHELRHHDRKTLRVAMLITATFLVAEVVGGLLSGSLALLADAGHMVTDLGGLVLAFFASKMSEAESNQAKTYGYLRMEILAALANGIFLVVISLVIAYEAVQRFREPPEVLGGVMLFVAIAGLIANLACAAVLHRSSKHSLNLRAAYLHVASDALGSVGAIAAAVGIQYFGWIWADPVVALAISGLIMISAWRIVKESVDVLMESTPAHVDLDQLQGGILGVPGVVAVHDLHVWTLTSGYHALSAHVDVERGIEPLSILRPLVSLAREQYQIDHTTFQLEETEASPKS